MICKVLPTYMAKVTVNADYALYFMHNYTFGTNFVLATFAGMMFYAGAMAVRKGQSVFYFMLINAVCLFAQWPTLHFLIYCLWASTNIGDYGYLLIPIISGNIFGANLWMILRKTSANFSNRQLLTPDEEEDIADRFAQEFVLNRDYLKKNKDTHFDTSDEHVQDS